MVKKKRKVIKKYFLYFLKYFCLSLGAIVMIAPFVWIVLTSLKIPSEAIVFPPTFIPDPFTMANYKEAFTMVPLARFFLNSIIYTTGMMIPSIFFCSLAGFTFAKLRFSGRGILFLLFITTMMVPMQVRLIPLYNLMVTLNWVDTYRSIIIPEIMGPFGVLLFRQSMLSIPNALIDAAKIDGCSMFRIYWNIALPQLKATIATFAIFSFMWSWNIFLWPLIIISKEELKPVEVGLTAFTAMNYTRWGVMAAGCFSATLPVIVFFLCMQKHFVKGVTLTGLKF